MVWLLMAAGRVTVKGLVFVVFGAVELFAVYVKLTEVTFAVGPDWAPAEQQQTKSKANHTVVFGTNVFMGLLSDVLVRNFSRPRKRATRCRSWVLRSVAGINAVGIAEGSEGFANRKPGTANIGRDGTVLPACVHISLQVTYRRVRRKR
jgi:hypothetical protein